jgi:hypothetical protein
LDPSLLISNGSKSSKSTAQVNHWDRVPTEIVLEILSKLSIGEVFSFASSCRNLYHQFGNPAFISLLLRTQLRRPLSSSYWFLPVATVKGEVEKFYQAFDESWASKSEAKTSNSADSSIVFHPDFPLFEFFRINYDTDSMKNRRRLWRISQQFRGEWYKYRTEGMQRTRSDI